MSSTPRRTIRYDLLLRGLRKILAVFLALALVAAVVRGSLAWIGVMVIVGLLLAFGTFGMLVASIDDGQRPTVTSEDWSALLLVFALLAVWGLGGLLALAVFGACTTIHPEKHRDKDESDLLRDRVRVTYRGQSIEPGDGGAYPIYGFVRGRFAVEVQAPDGWMPLKYSLAPEKRIPADSGLFGNLWDEVYRLKQEPPETVALYVDNRTGPAVRISCGTFAVTAPAAKASSFRMIRPGSDETRIFVGDREAGRVEGPALLIDPTEKVRYGLRKVIYSPQKQAKDRMPRLDEIIPTVLDGKLLHPLPATVDYLFVNPPQWIQVEGEAREIVRYELLSP